MKDEDTDGDKVGSEEGRLVEGFIEGFLVGFLLGIDGQMVVGIADGAEVGRTVDGIDGQVEVDGSADVCTGDGLRVGTTEGFNDGSYDGEVDGLNDGDRVAGGFDEGNALGSAEGADDV